MFVLEMPIIDAVSPIQVIIFRNVNLQLKTEMYLRTCQ